MAWPVLDELDQRLVLLITRPQLIHDCANAAHDVDVTPLVFSSEQIRLTRLALGQNLFQADCVVVYIQPVADVLALTIYRKRNPIDRLDDGERNQLLRELVRPVIVRAIRYDDRQTIRALP